MLLEALTLFGTLEAPGPANNSAIIEWAEELGEDVATAYAHWVSKWYVSDSTPWCGLFMAVVASRANPDKRPERQPPEKFLSAAEWAHWGTGVNRSDAMLGDVLVFLRPGGGHVALYVGEDSSAFHVLGGNQSDAVTVTRILKTRCTAARRPRYINQPANVRKIWLAPNGAVSRDEA